MANIITGISGFIDGALTWFGSVFTYLTSEEVFPFVLIGLGMTIVGFAFRYVRSLVKG